MASKPCSHLSDIRYFWSIQYSWWVNSKKIGMQTGQKNGRSSFFLKDRAESMTKRAHCCWSFYTFCQRMQRLPEKITKGAMFVFRSLKLLLGCLPCQAHFETFLFSVVAESSQAARCPQATTQTPVFHSCVAVFWLNLITMLHGIHLRGSCSQEAHKVKIALFTCSSS